MHTKHEERSTSDKPFHVPLWFGASFFIAVAVFFLWEEHEAHILGALPWLILLACPIMHLFMHRGHGHGGHGGGS